MKVNFKKVAIWTLIIGASGIAIWQIRKAIINRKADKAAEDAAANVVTTATITGSTPRPIPFDAEKVLKPGQASSPELVASKKAFNKVINMARSLGKIPNDVMDPLGANNQDEKRRKAIAGIELLDVNTKYGDGTKTAASIILGATDFTYSKAKAQAIAYAKKYNLKAPY